MRYYYNKKATTEESCDITIFQLKEWGMLAENKERGVEWACRNKTTARVLVATEMTVDEPYVVLLLTHVYGKDSDNHQIVPLTTTDCNFGGKRYWFQCPWCYNRVGALYIAPRESEFACRHCNNLSYHSRNRCNVATFGHTSRQIDKLRKEIKRWTWRGRPTRKARRIYALERKMQILSGPIMAGIQRLGGRIR